MSWDDNKNFSRISLAMNRMTQLVIDKELLVQAQPLAESHYSALKSVFQLVRSVVFQKCCHQQKSAVWSIPRQQFTKNS